MINGQDERQWYYFTFGVGQKYEGHYVRFFGTYEEARKQMVERHGHSWAFQYTEEEWAAWEDRCTKEGMLWMLETELK